ncbi:MAG: hypothetical protein WD025_08665 [Bacteriovoracaceae bacterium]
MKYFLLFSTITFMFVSCSGSKATPEEGADAGIELADAVEFTDESSDVVAESMPEALNDPLVEEGPVTEETPVFAEERPVEIDPVVNEPVGLTGEIGAYTVKENETLMMISFNLYGDYSKWREIANLNAEKLNGGTKIDKGMELKYNVPAQPFVFNPSGNPYLVKDGDYLGKVSMETYGTSKNWKAIWDNNKPLIKDPNVIFAGFTIYTPVIDGRDVAFDNL